MAWKMRVLACILVLINTVALADQRPGCLPTDLGTITWTLPTTPIGPSWSLTTKGADVSHSSGATNSNFTMTFWRRPCNVNDSQVLLTLIPQSGRPQFGPLSIFQNGTNPFFLYAVNDPEAYPLNNIWISGFPINKPVTVIIDQGLYGTSPGAFNPNHAFTISYTPSTVSFSSPPIALNIPPYNPAEYNLNNGSNSGVLPPNSQMGGLYYDPNRSGEGWQLTFGTSNGKPTLVATWYTYENGKQLWLLGSANYDATSTSIALQMARTEGADFGAAFKSTDVKMTLWGNATLEWQDCNTLHIHYQRQDGLAGDQTLTRFFYNAADESCF